MQGVLLRKMFLGFIHIHILHHAGREPFYGSWMIEELALHGYDMSAGTLYPILHGLQKDGLLSVEKRVDGGRARKYYALTPTGETVLREARLKAEELVREVL